jgi:hypothetical protein
VRLEGLGKWIKFNDLNDEKTVVSKVGKRKWTKESQPEEAAKSENVRQKTKLFRK